VEKSETRRMVADAIEARRASARGGASRVFSNLDAHVETRRAGVPFQAQDDCGRLKGRGAIPRGKHFGHGEGATQFSGVMSEFPPPPSNAGKLRCAPTTARLFPAGSARGWGKGIQDVIEGGGSVPRKFSRSRNPRPRAAERHDAGVANAAGRRCFIFERGVADTEPRKPWPPPPALRHSPGRHPD